jgi:hypothetical protein
VRRHLFRGKIPRHVLKGALLFRQREIHVAWSSQGAERVISKRLTPVNACLGSEYRDPLAGTNRKRRVHLEIAEALVDG